MYLQSPKSMYPHTRPLDAAVVIVAGASYFVSTRRDPRGDLHELSSPSEKLLVDHVVALFSIEFVGAQSPSHFFLAAVPSTTGGSKNRNARRRHAEQLHRKRRSTQNSLVQQQRGSSALLGSSRAGSVGAPSVSSSGGSFHWLFVQRGILAESFQWAVAMMSRRNFLIHVNVAATFQCDVACLVA